MMLALSVAITVPLLLLVLLVDNAQTRFLLLFFIWGSTAGFLASEINSELLAVAGISLQALQIQFAPLVEELLKAVPLAVLVVVAPKYLRRREIVLAAVFAGFGFSLVENFSYLIQQQQLSSFALTQYVITRSVSTTVMHGTATGVIGATVYYLSGQTLDQFGFKPLFALYSYCLAVLLHALFNIVVLFAVLGQTVAILSGLVSYLVLWVLFRTLH
ncbi:protease prsW family protein [Halohasta litchfieldiae]|jgi:RsiW-degrading membrane proteinase PrsW (M82 family)|uniref:Protease prsW family protein n=1 Tax=Halohasta litchfieldiae TaxID=1073996 RepID=A0A1H6YBI7_9EURY|nr:PrsW family glutamic-type intramembrane protease [Halohasta litchfieldiae]ATW88095.1 protease prsW family protein [Halohasta litchfieldiae]SEJ34562.1 Protease prsW family protein [Halohasta litchfieldiae]